MTNILKFKEIRLVFEKRDDGGLRVRSDDVPGFVLSNADCHAVFSDIAPALETILSDMFSARVRVGPLTAIRDDLENNGILPIYPRNGHMTYVAELCDA
jgi:hypothetical protein